MLYSVILPIYNVASYLKECLDSILRYEGELEVIAIDDGSTDDSFRILKSYSDPRLTVIHKENEGVFKTWKLGVMKAMGDYIVFVDPDDYIDARMFERANEILSKKSYDLIQFNWVYAEGKKLLQNDSYSGFIEGEYEGESLDGYLCSHLFRAKCERDIFPYYRWGKVFRAQLLKSLLPRLMDDISMFEDGSLTLPYLTTIKSLCISDREFYYYRINRPGSICASGNTAGKYRDIIRLTGYLENFGAFDRETVDVLLMKHYYWTLVFCISVKDYQTARKILSDERFFALLKQKKGFKYRLLIHKKLRTFRILRQIMLRFRRRREVKTLARENLEGV